MTVAIANYVDYHDIINIQGITLQARLLPFKRGFPL